MAAKIKANCAVGQTIAADMSARGVSLRRKISAIWSAPARRRFLMECASLLPLSPCDSLLSLSLYD
ncbi:MAG: hypothetical protein ACUVTH_07845, partial [Thermogutta sp.]